MSKTDGDRCILTLPLHTEPWQEQIIETRFDIMEHLKNSLIAMEMRKLKNLRRTKTFRDIEKRITETPKEERKALNMQRTAMLRDAGFSEFDFINDITPMQKHFADHIAAQIAHRSASDIWRAFESYLYSSGRDVHFQKRGTLDSVACKKIGNGMNYRNDTFEWSGGRTPNARKLYIPVEKPNTEYERQMLRKEIKNLRIVRKWMKTRFKYYLQLTLVGQPYQKERRIGNGRVGIDIGTRTIAIASDAAVRLLELADQVDGNHAKKCEIQRRMDASKRATNPENYNADGTIRRPVRGRKMTWHFSNNYMKMQSRVRELERKNADIRKYQHNCLANETLALGTDIFVEPMAYKSLQRRAKETKTDENGRYLKKKRFGQSLANKAPSMFLTILDNKLKCHGKQLLKVDIAQFRASQFDHTNGTYRKKLLSERFAELSNGDRIQRDMYSAFLLMNSNDDLTGPDPERCAATYERFKELHEKETVRIRNKQGRRIASFGI
jgi:hypothetical protein